MIDVRQQLIAEVDGEPAGFCIGMPDYTPIFRSFKGKMGPLQIARFLFSARRYKRAGLLAIGVLPKFRGQGVARALALNLYRYYESKALTGAFYYPVNDHNVASRRFAESIGGKGRILYHCFEKRI
jgi:ribosomal protein S18 acetylase RimI-like enzyme